MLLAYGPDQPDGDLNDRIELSVPLTAQARLDESRTETPWSSRRSLPDGRQHAGELVRAGDGWALRGMTAGDDAPLWDFEAAVLRPGEYVTLRRPGGEALVFRIVDVRSDQ